MGHRPAIHVDFCSHTLRVGRFAAQTDGQPRSNRFIAINQRRTIQTIDHDIEIAIVVQVRQRHSVGHFGRIESPFLGCFPESQIALVAEGDVRRCQAWKKQKRFAAFLQGEFSHPFNPLLGIDIIHVMSKTVAD